MVGLGLAAGALVVPTGVAADGAEIIEGAAGPLLEQINAYRIERGLGWLDWSQRLNASARAHAADMANHGVVSHHSSSGEGPFERIMRYYPYDTFIGENVAGGFATANAVLNAWRGSPAHNDQLLSPDYRVIGLGLAYNRRAPHRWYWAADFGGQFDH
jgi:uncharacterized protein YkwD